MGGVLGTVRSDRGAVGNVEVLPFCILVFVVSTLLITNAWAVVDARMAVASASREASRAMSEAPNGEAGQKRAVEAARDAIAGHGRLPERMDLRVEADGFARCEPVTVRVGYKVPAMHLPWIGGYGDAFDVWAAHTEIVDPYRSGLAGEARC